MAALLALSPALISCSGLDQKEDATPPTVMVEEGKEYLNQQGEDVFIFVTSKTDWVLKLSYDGETAEWASLTNYSGTGDSGAQLLTCKANPKETERAVTLTVYDKYGTASVDIFQKGLKSDEPASVRKGTPTATAKWLELPATNASDGMDFYHHPMTVDGKKNRNYSYYFDYDARVSVWVAYPLNSALIGGSGTRSDAWAADPLMPATDQALIAAGNYKGLSGMNRGHQIPSADRYRPLANKETFYGTNMTPQLGTFNSGVWAKLEDRVRAWAKSCDTLYVVTGCVVEPRYGVASDNAGKRVIAPGAYYKAVLRYNKNSTFGHSGYNACAVYLEHNAENASRSVNRSMAMSIRELERKTGVDFFVNLPALVGAQVAETIETEDPATLSYWWSTN
ncbi:MAG: DNA/RNA non-specific endonuclease [Bacteroidales bacterium]|nr:DNA/RNA non-specific endonuclease [Bacteroidales bacterium]